MSTWGSGGGWAYSAAKPCILERDNYACQLRYPGCTGDAATADVDDLQAACPHWQQQKTQQATAAAATKSTAKRKTRKQPKRRGN